MTTNAKATTIEPYAPSVLNRLYAAIERLPFGGWWFYPLTFAVLVAYYEVALWATGGRVVVFILTRWVGSQIV